MSESLALGSFGSLPSQLLGGGEQTLDIEVPQTLYLSVASANELFM